MNLKYFKFNKFISTTTNKFQLKKHFNTNIQTNNISNNINKINNKIITNNQKEIENDTDTKTTNLFRFNTGIFSIPNPNKKSSEDAFEIHDGMICLADGVGSWSQIGVDVSLFSKALCKHYKDHYIINSNRYKTTPKNIFIEASRETINTFKHKGSSTFCAAILDATTKNNIKIMRTVNMGDSGYMLIRPNNNTIINNPNKVLNKMLKDEQEQPLNILYKSEEQIHGFNTPFQVGYDTDKPEAAFETEHEIQENDIIIMGTDGLWDNLFLPQILAIIKPFCELSFVLNDITLIAELIGETCENYSKNNKYQSPFCKKTGGLRLGGKMDDITIIVSQIVKI
jgi:protein phosphatase PTC7